MSVRVCVCTLEVKHLGLGQGKARRFYVRGDGVEVSLLSLLIIIVIVMGGAVCGISLSFRAFPFLRTMLRHFTPTYLLFVISSLN